MTQGHNGSNWLADLMSNRPFIVGALFLGSYFAPFLVLIGFPLALVFQRRPEEEWEKSHFTYIVRTVYHAALIGALGILLALAAYFALGDSEDTNILMVFLALVIGGALLAYCGVRVLISLMKSASRIPMSNPKTWWI